MLQLQYSTSKYIFSEVEKGTAYLQICHALNDAGVRTRRGAEWQVPPLKYVLTNQTYAGRVAATLDGQYGVYEGKHPVIIPPEQFDRVQKILNERQAKHKPYARNTGKYVHWLSGLMRCPLCGASMSYRKGYEGRKPSYRCNGAVGGTPCKNGAIKVHVLEAAVYEELERVITDPAAMELIKVDHIRPKAVVDIDGQIGKLRNQLARAKKAYLEEIDTVEEYRENKVRIESAIRRLERRKEESKDPSVSSDVFRGKCQDALSVLKSDASMDDKAAVSHALIEKVEADSVKKEITVTFFG